jgi:hypothetical protein
VVVWKTGGLPGREVGNGRGGETTSTGNMEIPRRMDEMRGGAVSEIDSNWVWRGRRG